MTHDDSPRTPAEHARDNAVAGAEEPPVSGAEELTNRGVDRGVIIGQGLAEVSRWCLRLLVIAVAVAVLWWLLAKVWVGVFPVILALIVTTVLWPPTAWLRARGLPPALAAVLMTSGMLVAVAPPDDVNDAKRALTAQQPREPIAAGGDQFGGAELQDLPAAARLRDGERVLASEQAQVGDALEGA